MNVDQKFYSPLKIGIFIVTLAYFLFTFHAMFTLEWIGEWNRIAETFSLRILIEDISAAIGMVFRFVGSVLALATIIYFFIRKRISEPKLYHILRVIIVFEGIYWLGLIASGATGIYSISTALGNISSRFILERLFFYVIPAVVESTAIPISLFILARKLNPTKPLRAAIKWASISGAFFVLTFWLVNTGMWALTVWGSSPRAKGVDYLISFPQNMAGFLITAVGMLALTIYAAYFAVVIKAENLSELNLKPASIIILGTGLFFLSNYLIWIFFGGDHVWSDWYAWLLGHNLDLWMLSLPLVGVPLLFERKPPNVNVENSAP